MAEVTGPISTLPGARHELPEGTMCDWHPDRPAVARIQGETDSFGSELNDLCADCITEFNKPPEGNCDWCKSHAQLFTTRDYEEGTCGPVYYVCRNCLKKQGEALASEDAAVADDYDDYDYGDYYD